MNFEESNGQGTRQESLVVATPAPLATSAQSLGEGFEDISITPANMVMVQGTTRDPNAHPGTFRDMVTGQEYQSLKIVPFKIKTKPGPRVMFEKDAPFGSDPLCRSNDGVVPSPKIVNPMSSKCDGCRFADWGKAKAAGLSSPPCKEKASILFLERETELPFIISLNGKSVSPTNQMKMALIRLAKEQAAKGKVMSMYDFIVTMGCERRSDARGTYYVVTFGGYTAVRNLGGYKDMYYDLVTKHDVINKVEVPEEDSVIPDAQVVPSNQSADKDVTVDESSDIPF